MSYDLQVFKKVEGEEPMETIQSLFELEELGEEGGTELTELFVKALQSVFEPTDWSPDSDPAGEICHEEYGILISAYEQYINVSVAYWHSGEDAEAVISFVASFLNALVDQNEGLCIYDPQEDAVLPRLPLAPAQAHMKSGAELVRKFESGIEITPQKPWWKFW